MTTARTLARMDGRTKTARLIRDLRAELTQHVGGRPSATQRILIERIAMLATHLARMDAEALDAGGMSDHARKQYLAWDGSLRRAAAALGLQGIAQRVVPITEELANEAAARRRAAPAPAQAAA